MDNIDSEPIVKECDVLVAGGGIGGCFAAIKAKESGADKVIQICKGQVGHSGCSAFGAGNFSVVNFISKKLCVNNTKQE